MLYLKQKKQDSDLGFSFVYLVARGGHDPPTSGYESNLLTITNDGKVYAYILKYAEVLSKLNYFISDKMSIGNEKPKILVLKSKPSLDTIIINKNNHYKKFGDYLLKFKYHTIANMRKKVMRLFF